MRSGGENLSPSPDQVYSQLSKINMVIMLLLVVKKLATVISVGHCFVTSTERTPLLVSILAAMMNAQLKDILLFISGEPF